MDTVKLTALTGAIAALKQSHASAMSARKLLKAAGRGVSAAKVEKTMETLETEVAMAQSVAAKWMASMPEVK